MTPWVRTERLRLRPCGSGDLDCAHELWNCASSREIRRPSNRNCRISVLDGSNQSFTDRGYGIWLFFDAAEEERSRGFAGLLHHSAESPRLVFGTRPALRGRGYAGEASRTVLRHGFAVLGLPRVFAEVDEPNQASIAVLRKLGMQRTGREIVGGRPLLYYEIASAL